MPGRGTDPPRPAGIARQRRKAAAGAGSAALPAPPKSAALAPAAARQLEQLPAFAPLMEEIELAGWSSHRRRLSGNFHDWMLLGDGRVLVAAGQATGTEPSDPTDAALVSQAAWATIRAHALHVRDAGALLSLTTRSLWPTPRTMQNASMAVALVDPVGGRVSVAVAGDCLVWRIRAATIEQLSDRQPPLGAASDFTYRTHELELSLRERLLLVADQPARRAKQCISSIEATFTHCDAESHRRMTAADAVALVREHFDEEGDRDAQTSASIVAVRRR